jgi:hypothetical protein
LHSQQEEDIAISRQELKLFDAGKLLQPLTHPTHTC